MNWDKKGNTQIYFFFNFHFSILSFVIRIFNKQKYGNDRNNLPTSIFFFYIQLQSVFCVNLIQNKYIKKKKIQFQIPGILFR